MEELAKDNFVIKTDDIFLKYKYQRISTNFEGQAEKGFLASNTRASYKKLDIKEKETENDADNNTFCESINNPEIINEEESLQDNKINSISLGNFNNLEKESLIKRKNSSFNDNNYQLNSRAKNKIYNFDKQGSLGHNSFKNEEVKKLHCNK